MAESPPIVLLQGIEWPRPRPSNVQSLRACSHGRCQALHEWPQPLQPYRLFLELATSCPTSIQNARRSPSSLGPRVAVSISPNSLSVPRAGFASHFSSIPLHGTDSL